VVNYPLKYFAERIGGELIDVRFPAPSGVDPAFWKPSAETINKYQNADLILLNGAAYAKWISTATLPEARMVNTMAALQAEYIEVTGALLHAHGPEGEHSHAGTAFTTWLDPLMAVEQARAIKNAFQKLLPQRAQELETRFSDLEADLRDLDRQTQELVNKNPETLLVASHPVYQYLARRYKLQLESVHWEPDEYPHANALKNLETLLKRHPARGMIWEGTPIDESVKMLNDKGIQSTVFDPCSNVPQAGDYLSVMRDNVRNLRSIFEIDKSG
jgi:zinc transport system substrate-binding protein